MTILRITIILLTLLFPSYAVLLGPNQNVVQAGTRPSLSNPLAYRTLGHLSHRRGGNKS